MPVRIRLQRHGRNKLPQYAIVATDSRNSRDKKFIEKLGQYHPLARGQEQPFVLNEDALNAWIGKGAQPSDTVCRLLVKFEVGPAKVKDAYLARKQQRIKAQEYVAKLKAEKEPKAEEAPAEAAAEAAPAEEVSAPTEEAPAAEAPAEEVKAEEAPEAKAEETPVEEPKAEEAPEAKAEEATPAEEKPAEDAPAEEEKKE